jgi:hypothetical protein
MSIYETLKAEPAKTLKLLNLLLAKFSPPLASEERLDGMLGLLNPQIAKDICSRFRLVLRPEADARILLNVFFSSDEHDLGPLVVEEVRRTDLGEAPLAEDLLKTLWVCCLLAFAESRVAWRRGHRVLDLST